MHDFDIEMGAQSIRAGRRRVLTGTVIAAVSHLPRELFVGLNDAIHRDRQLRVGGSEEGIGFH